MRLFYTFVFLVLSSTGLYAGSGYGSEFDTKAETEVFVNPFKGIKKVAIIPFFSLTDKLNPMEFAVCFAGQIENYPNWEVIYPQMVVQLAASQNKTIFTPHDAISIARQLGADAVLLGEIRSFDPYYPPKMVIKVALYRTGLRDSSRDIIDLARRGIATNGRVGKVGDPIYEISESYDSGREHVMKLIRRYAARFDQTDDPMQFDLFLRSRERFFEAISYTIREDMLYAQNKAQTLEAKGSDSSHNSREHRRDRRKR